MTRNGHRLSGAIAETARGKQINQLTSVIVALVEHRYTSRADRRHTPSGTGGVLNIPKTKQAPGLNEPYRPWRCCRSRRTDRPPDVLGLVAVAAADVRGRLLARLAGPLAARAGRRPVRVRVLRHLRLGCRAAARLRAGSHDAPTAGLRETMTVNVPLLRKTLEHIEAHPEEWDQDVWRCESGMCFAGRAAHLSGGQWMAEPSHIFSDYLLAEDADPAEEIRTNLFVAPSISAKARAQRVLGLDVATADRLFDGPNTLDDLRRIVAELSEGGAS